MKPGEGVEIKLDRKRTLRFDMNAQMAYEKATGENTLEPAFWKRKKNATFIATMAWACLLHEDKTLTLEQVGAMINARNLPRLTIAVMGALTASIPKEGEEAAEEDEGKNA